MTLSRDPAKLLAWRRRGAKNYEARKREEALAGEGKWNSLDGARKRRPKKETERIYGPPDRPAWMRRQPSVVSGRTPCVSAHVKAEDPMGPSGTGRKANARWTVPLTYEEHVELHANGQETFEREHGIDLARAARETHARWLEERGGNGGTE